MYGIICGMWLATGGEFGGVVVRTVISLNNPSACAPTALLELLPNIKQAEFGEGFVRCSVHVCNYFPH